MGQKKKKGRRKQANPVFAGILFAVVVLAIAGISIVVEKFKPSDTQADLYTYYDMPEESKDALVILNLEKAGTNARYLENDVYLELSFLQEKIDKKFYWDANEEILIYTTPTEVIKAVPENNYYTATSKTETDYIPVRKDGESVYVNLEFVETYTNVTHKEFAESGPKRLLLWSEKHDLTVAPAKRDAVVRTGESIKDDVVEQPEEGELLTCIMEDTVSSGVNKGVWYYVLTADGNLGYIKSDDVGTSKTVEDTNTYSEPEYTSISSDEKIRLAWHQVTNQTANKNLMSMMSGTKGINVISPTWFSLSDTKGNFSSLANETYVNDAHNVLKCQVWALIDDFGRDDAGNTYISQVLPYTSKRENLINQLMISARTYGFDGINIDFEMVSRANSEDYLQFLRELSVECRKAGLVLSVDNYVPMAYNMYYGRDEQGVLADYVIIMGYDEHTAGADSAGSVASLPFVQNGITDTLKEVPAEKVINAVPFYTRVWKETPEQYAKDGDTIVEDAVNGNYALSSEAVSMDHAKTLVEEHKAEKTWLEDLGQYYAEYKDGNSTVRIWLEDDASLEEKMKLVSEYNLAGVAGWKLGLENSSVWDVITKYTK